MKIKVSSKIWEYSHIKFLIKVILASHSSETIKIIEENIKPMSLEDFMTRLLKSNLFTFKFKTNLIKMISLT